MQPIGWRQLKSTFSTSLWAVPILAIPLAMIATRALHWLDAKTEWTLLGFGVPGAQTISGRDRSPLIPGVYVCLFARGDSGRERTTDGKSAISLQSMSTV